MDCVVTKVSSAGRFILILFNAYRMNKDAYVASPFQLCLLLLVGLLKMASQTTQDHINLLLDFRKPLAYSTRKSHSLLNNFPRGNYTMPRTNWLNKQGCMDFCSAAIFPLFIFFLLPNTQCQGTRGQVLV